MKILGLFTASIFATLVTTAHANEKSKVSVAPLFNGKEIYVGSGAPDLPSDLYTVLEDLVCQSVGFASEADGKVRIVSLTAPTEVAIPVLNAGTPELRLYTLDPKYSPSIAVIEWLGCWTKN
jgi:hypothetical protein